MNSIDKSNKNSSSGENVKLSKKKGKNRKINQQQQQQQQQQNDQNKKIIQQETIKSTTNSNIDCASSNSDFVIKSLNGKFEKNLQINENGSTTTTLTSTIDKHNKLEEFLNGSSTDEQLKNPKNQLNGEGGANSSSSKSICSSSSNNIVSSNNTSKNLNSKKSKRKSINNDEIIKPSTTIITNNGDNNNKNNDNLIDNNNTSGKNIINNILNDNDDDNDHRSNVNDDDNVIIKSCNSNLSNNSKNCQKNDDENNHHHNHQENCSNNSNEIVVDKIKEIDEPKNSSAQLLSLPSGSSSLLLSSLSAVETSSTITKENVLDLSNVVIEYKEYESELQMQDIMRLIQAELSEPYSIYTYRYFIYNWPKLCFLAAHGNEYVGAIVCKLDMHMHVVKRGYIAMLAVKKEYRKLKIGTNLVQKAIEAMLADDADEVVLETEMKNLPALRLYENLGFVRDKRLFRYYLNGVDALRLKLWFR